MNSAMPNALFENPSPPSAATVEGSNVIISDAKPLPFRIASKSEKTGGQISVPRSFERQSGGPGEILAGIFQLFDSAGIPYCVLHGYDEFPCISSDVDCVISSKLKPRQLYALLYRNSTKLRADIVRCNGYHIVLAGKNADGSPCFLTLDMSVDCELDGVQFYAGHEVLASRRRHRQFWIPAAHLEFGCYLARSVAKARIDGERSKKLSSLYQQDAAGCEHEVARFWGARSAKKIVLAARTSDWLSVSHHIRAFQSELRRNAVLRAPGGVIGSSLHGIVGRLRRIWRPHGLSVVLLGPDGAGKSSVIATVGPSLTGAFPRWTCWGFAPPLRRLLDRSSRPTDQPHALAPRSPLTSTLRAGYWFGYYTFGYVALRLALSRSTLVMYDRHFVDILVDRTRYRYGGPLWLIQLIWRLIPKPDLIILLDAPAEVLQARKQEVPFEETVRQRSDYLSLIRSMPTGHVVNSAQPLEAVVCQVSDIILRQLARRVPSRFGLDAAQPTDPRMPDI
jgi:thymidylate kinase